jgi:GH24 family phage-related lysozyme (muramidase)
MKWILSLFATAAIHGDSIPAGPLQISPESKDLIVEFETGGRSYYQAKLQRPTWPGGASGVTIGIGYDVGYNTRTAVISDWQALPEGSRNALASAAGVKGVAAKSRASALKWIIVPWQDAENLFVRNTMPRFGKMTNTAFPGITRTHGHVQGVMLSIVFNRGASMAGDGRIEMRAIRGDLQAGRITDIPRQIRSMKRLWVGKGLPGLLRRREAEAALIERSLRTP